MNFIICLNEVDRQRLSSHDSLQSHKTKTLQIKTFFKLIIFCAAMDLILGQLIYKYPIYIFYFLEDNMLILHNLQIAKYLINVTFPDPVLSCSSKARYKGTYRKCNTQDCVGKSACATIYEDYDFSGWQQCLSFEPDNCIKLNPWWVENGVKSVNSHETCIRLYDLADCSGGAVEIQPNDVNQSNLKKFKFHDIAKSASSCSRNIGKGQCYLRNNFYNKIDAEKFSTASINILETMDTVVELVTSGAATVIPGIDTFYSGLQFVAEMFKKEDSTEQLIDQKITKALGESAVSQVSAKISVVEKK